MARKSFVLAVVIGLLTIAVPASANADRTVTEISFALFTTVSGCEESVNVTGTEHWTITAVTTPADVIHVTFEVVWDAVGEGNETGQPYEVTYRKKFEEIFWPDLFIETPNVQSGTTMIQLRSEVAGAEMHKIQSHRVLHADGVVTGFQGIFEKDNC